MNGKITLEQIRLLGKIADLVEQLCGSEGEHAQCRCPADEYDDLVDEEHDTLCAWDITSALLDQLATIPDYKPGHVASTFEEVRDELTALVQKMRDEDQRSLPLEGGAE